MSSSLFYRQLQFASDPNNARLVEDCIIDMAESCGLDDDTTNSLMIAVTEATNNAIHHGNKDNPDKQVWVDMDLKADRLTVSVRDEGAGFDPSSIPDPLADENLLKTSGRGVFLMKNIMKSVDFKFEPRGTTVIMTFQVGFIS